MPEWLRNISPYLETIVPLIILVVSIAFTIFKKLKNKKLGPDEKKEFYIETIAITITVAYFVISYKLDAIDNSINALKNNLHPPQEVSFFDKVDDKSVVDFINEELVAIDENNTFKSEVNVMYSRAQFTPTPQLGFGEGNDRTISEKFKNGAYALRYIIGFPVSEEGTKQQNDIAVQKDKMNKFAFALLTAKLWSKKENIHHTGNYVSFYYIPIKSDSKYPNTWSVSSSSDKCLGGFCFTKGNWDEQYSYPNPSEIITIRNNSLSRYIKDQHASFQTWGKEFIIAQKRKESWEREPIMIFCSDKDDKLIPKGIDDICRIRDVYISSWKNTNEKNTLPPRLKELNDLVNYIKYYEND